VDLKPGRYVAHAKLTTSLRIVGVRPDGFHLIDAEMVSISLADELVVAPSAQIQLSVESVQHGLAVWSDQSNTVWKALDQLGLTADVQITKRIPAGAGLGGASTDAAAILRAAGAIEWDGAQRASVAASIGADVMFCVLGGRARVTGIGEVIEPLAQLDADFTLVTPPFGVSTPAVYKAWDELGGPTGDNSNDLETAACVVEPRLLSYRDALGNATGQTPRLAGSGSTWFVAGKFPEIKEATVVSTIASSEVIRA